MIIQDLIIQDLTPTTPTTPTTPPTTAAKDNDPDGVQYP